MDNWTQASNNRVIPGLDAHACSSAYRPMSETFDADVIIAGAGMAGATLALALKQGAAVNYGGSGCRVGAWGAVWRCALRAGAGLRTFGTSVSRGSRWLRHGGFKAAVR